MSKHHSQRLPVCEKEGDDFKSCVWETMGRKDPSEGTRQVLQDEWEYLCCFVGRKNEKRFSMCVSKSEGSHEERKRGIHVLCNFALQRNLHACPGHKNRPLTNIIIISSLIFYILSRRFVVCVVMLFPSSDVNFLLSPIDIFSITSSLSHTPLFPSSAKSCFFLISVLRKEKLFLFPHVLLLCCWLYECMCAVPVHSFPLFPTYISLSISLLMTSDAPAPGIFHLPGSSCVSSWTFAISSHSL